MAAAVADFIVVSRNGHRMLAANLPLLPHQEAAARVAQEKIEAMRPGFVDDLITASQRKPGLSADGVAAVIAAGERVRAEREEEVRRQAEHAALAPVRERLVKERMEEWWRKTYPLNPAWDRTTYMHNTARPVEEALRREIEAMPAAELRRVEAAWARADRTRKPSPKLSPAPRYTSPSPF